MTGAVAPKITNKGFNVNIPKINIIEASAKDINKPCIAVFSASSLFFEPKDLEILEPIPAPKPEFREINIKNKGNEKVKAAIASAPSLPTKAVSTILYSVCTNIAMIIGKANVRSAFFGFLMNSSTRFFCIFIWEK